MWSWAGDNHRALSIWVPAGASAPVSTAERLPSLPEAEYSACSMMRCFSAAHLWRFHWHAPPKRTASSPRHQSCNPWVGTVEHQSRWQSAWTAWKASAASWQRPAASVHAAWRSAGACCALRAGAVNRRPWGPPNHPVARAHWGSVLLVSDRLPADVRAGAQALHRCCAGAARAIAACCMEV